MTVYMFPGQGSQKVGMGEGLFERYPQLVSAADAILGYSIQELCLQDPQKQLGHTSFTQPALYVVNALTYHSKLDEAGGQKPKAVLGHSLGEYSALYAAGAFDFETGLRLVQKRGELMGGISGGGMAAVIGKRAEDVLATLKSHGMDSIDAANYNSHTQLVISGMREDVLKAEKPLSDSGAMFFPLNVSGAFHSRYMAPVKEELAKFMDQFTFQAPDVTCIANCTAKPYSGDDVKSNLLEQLDHSVKWCDSMEYLMATGETEFQEVGPGMVLTGLCAKIKQKQ